MSVVDRQLLVLRALRSAREGLTVVELDEWIQHHAVDRPGLSTLRAVLLGLMRLRLVERYAVDGTRPCYRYRVVGGVGSFDAPEKS